MINIEKLKRKIARAKKRSSELNDLHSGKETNYSYYGGWSNGYECGRLSAMQDILDEIEEKDQR